MDSSPGLAAVSVRPAPGGIVGPLAGAPAEVVTRRGQESGGPAGAVKEN
jgi:hypothetical protein